MIKFWLSILCRFVGSVERVASIFRVMELYPDRSWSDPGEKISHLYWWVERSVDIWNHEEGKGNIVIQTNTKCETWKWKNKKKSGCWMSLSKMQKPAVAGHIPLALLLAPPWQHQHPAQGIQVYWPDHKKVTDWASLKRHEQMKALIHYLNERR